MTPAEKEQLWNCIMQMRSMPWRGPRGGVNNWSYRDMRKLYEKLVAYGDNNQPNAAWRLLNSGKYNYMIYPWKKSLIYNCISFGPPPPACDDVWICSFYDPAGSSFSGWELNGYFDYDWSSLAASFGGTYVLDFSPYAPPFSGPSQATFIYTGTTPPPTLSGFDASLNPVTYSFTKFCDKRVFQSSGTPPASAGITSIIIGDIAIDVSMYGINAYIDIDVAQNTLTSVLRNYFPDAFCTMALTPTPGGSIFSVEVFNVYGLYVTLNLTFVGPYSLGSSFLASDFDFTSLPVLAFSNIGYDSATSEYTYATQQINFNVPNGFVLNFKVKLDVTVPIYTQRNTTPPFTNGEVSTTNPTTITPVPFNVLQDGEYMFAGINGWYLSFTTRYLPATTGTYPVQLLLPYTGYSPLTSFDNILT